MQDIIISNNKNDQEIVLTQFETAQGWKVKIDLNTQDIYTTTSDLITLLGWTKGGAAAQKISVREVSEHLRALDLSDQRKELKLGTGSRALCFDIEQVIAILDFFNSPILKTSQRFGLEVAIKQACGLLEKPISQLQPQTLPTKIELAEAYMKVAKLEQSTNDLPGLADLDNQRIHHITAYKGLPGRITITEFLSTRYLPNSSYHTFCKRVNAAARLQTNNSKLPRRKGLNRKGGLKYEMEFPTSFTPTMELIYQQMK